MNQDTQNRIKAAGLIRRLRAMYAMYHDQLLEEAAVALECSFEREHALLEKYNALVAAAKKASIPTD